MFLIVGIVVAGHGGLAKALINTAELIVGPLDACATVQIFDEDAPINVEAQLAAAASTVDSGDGCLILLDVLGGTPSNAAAMLVATGGVEAVTGVSLPMLLGVLTSRSGSSLVSLRDTAVSAGVAGVKDLRSMLESAINSKDIAETGGSD